MKIHNIEQNTEDWYQIRLGKITASRCADLLMDEKNKGYQGLIRDIAEERITKAPVEGKWQGNAETERGHMLEPFARYDFEMETFHDVELVGFVEKNNWVGCSPDGFVGAKGMVQFKCPIFKTQEKYLDTQKIPGNYAKQMQYEMYVCERDWNIFYSYHPHLKAVMIKLERDEEVIKEIERKLKIAKQQIKERINKLEK